jgi:prepilin-type processing-associated H-X9-DG protein
MSNMKQIGLASMQYTQDYDEVMWGQDDPCRWPGYVYPYIKARGVFECPANGTNLSLSSGQVKVSYAWNANVYMVKGFAMNRYIAPSVTVQFFEFSGRAGDPTSMDCPNPGYCYPTKTAQACAFAGNCAYSGAAGTAQGAIDTGQMGGTCTINDPVNSQCRVNSTGVNIVYDPLFPNGRHNEGSTFTFADGHAKWYKGSNVSAGGSKDTTTAFQSNQWWADGTAIAQQKGEATFSYL